MRKDTLAAGARSAKFAGGVGENDIFRNVSKEEKTDTVVAVEEKIVVRKKFIPLEGVILVRRQEIEKSSVLITDTMEQEKPAEGTIVERGPKVPLEVGTQVVFGKYAGAEFRLNGETLLLMKVEDILGSVEDEKPSYLDQPETWQGVGGCTIGRA